MHWWIYIEKLRASPIISGVNEMWDNLAKCKVVPLTLESWIRPVMCDVSIGDFMLTKIQADLQCS